MWLEQLPAGRLWQNHIRFHTPAGNRIFGRCFNRNSGPFAAAVGEIARAFQQARSRLCATLLPDLRSPQSNIVFFRGGVFQNELLMEDLKSLLEASRSKSGQIMRAA